MKTKSNVRRNSPKFVLCGVSPVTGENFMKEAHSLNEVIEIGMYMVTATNVTADDGLPENDYGDKNCLNAYLFVTSSFGSKINPSVEVVGQMLIISGRVKAVTSIYTRSRNESDNGGFEWTPWQMLLGGDINVISPSADLFEQVTKLSDTINNEITHITNVEKNCAASLVSKTKHLRMVDFKNIAYLQAYNPISCFIDGEIYRYDNGDIGTNTNCFRVEPIKLLCSSGATIAWIGAVPAYTVFYSDVSPSESTFISATPSTIPTVPEGAKYAAAYFRRTANPELNSVILYQPVLHWYNYFNKIKPYGTGAQGVCGEVYPIFSDGVVTSLRLQAVNTWLKIPLSEDVMYNYGGRLCVYKEGTGLVGVESSFPTLEGYAQNAADGWNQPNSRRKLTSYLSVADIVKLRTSSSNYLISQIVYYNTLDKAEYSEVLSLTAYTPNYNYKYMRVQIKKVGEAVFTEYDTDELRIETFAKQQISKLCTTVDETPLFPRNIYLVCNDAGNGGYNRNISPAIYLDHCFRNLNEKSNIQFSDGGVKQVFGFESTLNSSWEPTLNAGKDVNIVERSLSLVGSNAPETEFKVNIISTKATASATKTPRVLVVGSSTVYGEGATYNSNGGKCIKPYHALCWELFKKDNVDQGGNNECILLGTVKHQSLSMNYNDAEYTYSDYCEGYRGETIDGFMSMDKFVDESGAFSLSAWLAKYRTMDDEGRRLYFTADKGYTGVAGTENAAYLDNGELATDSDGNQIYLGSLVTNSLSMNVCAPTHIVWHLGANNGATLEQLQTLVSVSKRDFPESFVALVMNDSMGTIFPDHYPDADLSKCRWNVTDKSDNRHQQNFDIQKLYDENFETEEYREQGVYVLPFFFVANPLFFSIRECNLPEYEFNGEDSKHLHPWGWYPATHADIRAHCNYAYQLYSWIKYTLTL